MLEKDGHVVIEVVSHLSTEVVRCIAIEHGLRAGEGPHLLSNWFILLRGQSGKTTAGTACLNVFGRLIDQG